MCVKASISGRKRKLSARAPTSLAELVQLGAEPPSSWRFSEVLRTDQECHVFVICCTSYILHPTFQGRSDSTYVFKTSLFFFFGKKKRCKYTKKRICVREIQQRRIVARKFPQCNWGTSKLTPLWTCIPARIALGCHFMLCTESYPAIILPYSTHSAQFAFYTLKFRT